MEKPALKRRVFKQIFDVYSRLLVSLHREHFASSSRDNSHSEHTLTLNLELKVVTFALDFLQKLTGQVKDLHPERHIQDLRNAHHGTARDQIEILGQRKTRDDCIAGIFLRSADG